MEVVKETHEITYLFINIYLDRVVYSVHILFFIEPCNKTIKKKTQNSELRTFI